LAFVKPGLAPSATGGELEVEKLLTAAQVAKVLGVRPKRVYELGIPAVKLSERALRWKPSQLAAWIQEREAGV
jgi:predicted DNA-binding transcriptional regulator AlpA